VRRRLAENHLKPWRKDMWCIPQVEVIETTELGHHEPSGKIGLGLGASFLGDTGVGARGHGGPIGSPAQTRRRS
jgi:hypothetical protein